MVISIFGNSIFEHHTSKLVKFASIFGNFLTKSLLQIFHKSCRMFHNFAESYRIKQTHAESFCINSLGQQCNNEQPVEFCLLVIPWSHKVETSMPQYW